MYTEQEIHGIVEKSAASGASLRRKERKDEDEAAENV